MESENIHGALTYAQFCQRYNLSLSFFYELLHRGQAPKIMSVGRRRMVSFTAAREWERQCESAPFPQEAA